MSGPERIAYREVDGRELALHVWRPATPHPAPMVLDVHGGAWTHFTPAVDRLWCRRLAEAGFVVASAEFRRSSTAPWPACRDDVREAARWLRANAERVGGDPGRLAVMGGSTGGHLALLAGLEPLPGGEVDRVIALWPVVDVARRYEMVTTASFGRIATAAADRAARRSAGSSPQTGDPVARRLARLDDLRCRRPALGGAVGWLVQRLNAWSGMLAPARASLYRELAAAHEQTFPPTAAQQRAGERADRDAMADAGAGAALERRLAAGLGAPPSLLVVQGTRDPNIEIASAEALVVAWRRAGAPAELVRAPGLGHSYGNVASGAADRLIDRLVATLREPVPSVEAAP